MKKILIPVLLLIGSISCTNSANNKLAENKSLVSDTTQIKKIKDTILFDCNYLGETPPGDEPKLFAPNVISTGDLHSSLYFSPNGKEIYYTRLTSEGDNSGILCRKFINGKWTEAEMVKGTEEALTPFISLDGERLFCSLPHELFVMNRTENGWSEPINLGKEINFQKRQDGIYESAKRTIFYTTMFGENNGIYYSEFKDGNYQHPVKIETGLADVAIGYSYIAPNEEYIIFQSRAKGGYGASDLYIMFKNDDGSWTKAVNMGSKINTKDSESFPYVTPDSKYFFFNSNRISQVNSKVPGHFYGNVYWMKSDLIEEIREKVSR